MCYNFLMRIRCYLFTYLGNIEVLRWYEEREGGDLRQLYSLGVWQNGQLLSHHDHDFVPYHSIKAFSSVSVVELD